MTRPAVEVLESRKLLATNLVTLGSAGNDAAFAVAALSDGGQIVSGTFGGTIDFDPGAGTRNLTSVGQTDIFMARYAADGALNWAARIGGGAGDVDDETLYSTIQATIGDFINNVGPTIDMQGEYVSTLKVGADNRIYLGGSFQGTVDFDPGDDTAVNRKAEAYHDAFVACFEVTDGSLVWASAFGGPFDDTVKDLAVTSDGAAIATGYFTRDADFNPTKVEKRIVADGRDDIFVINLAQTDLEPIGRLQWIYTAGGDAVDLPERDSGEGIVLDGSGNVYITGSFAGEADWDPSRSQLIVKGIDKSDAFLLRLSPKGKLDYIQSFGGDEFDSGKNIAIDDMGRLYLSGYFSEQADLDPGDGETFRIASEDGDAFDLDNEDDGEGSEQIDLFLSQVSLRGELQWVNQIGGDDYEYLSRMDVVSDRIILSGAFAGRLILDFSSILINSLQSTEGDDDFDDDNNRDSSYDAFIAQYSTDGSFVDKQRFGGTGDDWANAAVAGATVVQTAGIFRNATNFNRDGTGQKRKAVGLQDLFAASIELF